MVYSRMSKSADINQIQQNTIQKMTMIPRIQHSG